MSCLSIITIQYIYHILPITEQIEHNCSINHPEKIIETIILYIFSDRVTIQLYIILHLKKLNPKQIMQYFKPFGRFIYILITKLRVNWKIKNQNRLR